MTEQTWMNPKINRAGWDAGEWDNEPDKVQWTDPATGLICLAKRNHYGSWCGYVGIAADHPAYGKDYDSVEVDCHGGLTYSGLCQEGPPEQIICHVPESGQPEHLYWLGFDCGHCDDLAPGTRAFCKRYALLEYQEYEVYRNLDYVKQEVTGLAAQLGAMK